MNKSKPTKPFHTANTKSGSGDFYGSGVKNPVMKPKEIMGNSSSKKKAFGKPPKSMA